MSSLEDRVREAYLAVAELVREDAVPAGAPTRRAGSRRRATSGAKNMSTRHKWWIAPVTTAAAVAVIAVTGAVIVPHFLAAQHSRPHMQSPGTARTRTHSPHGALAHPATIPGLPEFTVVSTDTGLKVVQTATGRVTGQVSSPAGQIFDYLSGDGSDRTFYVSAQQADVMATCRAYFYRFSLNADGQASALTQLPGWGQPGLPTALAASADGRKLAFSVTHCGGNGGGGAIIPPSQAIGYIGLLDIPSGRVTGRWTYTLGEDYATSMALTPDGNLLAFAQYLPNGTAMVVKSLRTDAPSGTVDQASTVLGLPGAAALSVGPDLYACVGTDRPGSRVANQLGVYGLTTGHQTAVLHTWTGLNARCSLAQSSVSGHVLVAIATAHFYPGASPFTVRVLAIDVRTGRLTPLLTTIAYTSDAGTLTLIGW